MIKHYLLGILAVFCVSAVQAQGYSVQGILQDKQSGKGVQAATILLESVTDTSHNRSVISDTAGRFWIMNVLPDSFNIVFSTVGYSRVSRGVRIDAADIDLEILISRKPGELQAVTVTATISPVTMKGDTVQYNASQYKVNPDATVEDLAKKMPGITVEDGQLKANGEVVQKVTIDGREFFGDDATAAVKNLPAEIVDKIQVFDRLSDQAQFTGVDDGNTNKGINIITKANMRNGQFGRVYAGYGTDGKYQAGGNTTQLKENRKLSFVGNFNNINQQNFATQDLLGVTNSSSQGGRGGGRGGRGGGGNNQGNSNNGNFLVGQQNGINKTNAFGINYADIWGKKATVSGSYFFNSSANNSDELLNRQYFSNTIPNLSQVNLASNTNTNHRVNLRIEYKFDSANQLIITPNASVQLNNSDKDATTSFIKSAGTTLSRTHNLVNGNKKATNLNNNILFRHAFPKRGRTYSINLNTSYNNRIGDVYTTQFDTTFLPATFRDSTARRYTDQFSNGYQLSSNFIYTEPLSLHSQLQANYNPGYTKSKADQQAYQYDGNADKYDIFNPTLSSKFENTTASQKGGLTYRYFTKDNQFSAGVDFQQTNLKSDRTFPTSLKVKKTFQNFLPNAMFRLKLSEKSNLRILYRANTNQPSVTQLQDVYDITGLPFVTAGNPQLEQQYMQSLSGRYTFADTKRGMLFVGNIFYQAASNFITSATFVPLRDSVLNSNVSLKSGQQLTKPVNLDGYNSFRSFFTFAVPIKLIKSNLNMNAGVTLNKLPGIINNQLNKSTNITYSLGTVIGSNISQYVDFSVSYSANINKVNNDINTTLNQQYFSQVAGLQLNLLSKKGWFFQTDLSNLLYSGLAAGYNQNYYLWNMSAGKKFFKKQQGELKIGVFDVLKQNRSIVRNITETYIEDQQSQVLQQYFMLTFSYNLKNFGKGVPQSNPQRRRGRFGSPD